MRIAFFGTSSEAIPTLQALAAVRNITAVFCNPDRPKGRGRQLTIPPVKQIAQELNVPCYQPERWSVPQSKELWESLHIDLAIVVSYGFILPKWLLTSCRLGVWNLHFSLLPKWRGASPVNHALLEGDDITGVSLMRLTIGLDEGPIADQCSRPITMHDNAQVLLGLLAQDAADLLIKNLFFLEEGTIQLTNQDSSFATWAPKLTKTMSIINIHQKAIELHRTIRALQPWPGITLTIDTGGNAVKIHDVGDICPTNNPPGTLAWNQSRVWLTAGDGAAVELTKLQRPGKPIQPAAQALQFLGAKNILYLA